jgi:hypothetical protein
VDRIVLDGVGPASRGYAGTWLVWEGRASPDARPENEMAATETGGSWSPWRPVMSPACAWACRAAGRAVVLGKGFRAGGWRKDARGKAGLRADLPV